MTEQNTNTDEQKLNLEDFKRISIGNKEFEGDNNSYLLKGENRNILIDTAISLPQPRNQLEKGLEDAGLGYGDVDAVFLTHWHADHVGLAGEIQNESGCRVYAHEKDAGVIEQNPENLEEIDELSARYMREWGAPDDKIEELNTFLNASESVSGEPAKVETFDDGDTFDFGKFELEVLHAPGHAAGMSSFVIDDTVFSGDALLPVYTPNVGGSDLRVERPLEKYIETLKSVIERDFDTAYPGHRYPIDSPSERAREIIEHHRERARKIVGVLTDEPKTVWEISDELFGELKNIHIIHGPGEAYAHLEHMERDGSVKRVSTEPVKYAQSEDSGPSKTDNLLGLHC